jgi:SET domain-containing protein
MVEAGGVAVRRSALHGRGAFARAGFAAGETVLDYAGRRITWAQACADHAADGVPGHTFYFDLGGDTVIDGGTQGNAARWINHSCEPNCEAINEDARIIVRTVAPVRAGDELTIDYRLIIEDPEDLEQRALYDCACGAAGCRGTMLAT